MSELKGTLKRTNEGLINIKLNKEVKGKVYYKDKLDGEETFLFDFDSEEIGFMDPNVKDRTFYVIEDEMGERLTLAERLIPLRNFCNFRDLGGYETADNRCVRWGVFYRSEELSELKEEDLEYFKTLEIKTVLDYRGVEECNSLKDVQVDGVENINIPAMNGYGKGYENLDMRDYIAKFLKGETNVEPRDILKNAYKYLPFDNEAYKILIEKLKDENNCPILQHCTAGKDRTGVGSALILLLLGVDEKVVMKDYLDSNFYRKNTNRRIVREMSKQIKNEQVLEMLKKLLGVEKELMFEALDTIKDKYETYENYFKEEYGLSNRDIEEIRNKYLD